jgi:hypothetical protein
VFYTTLSYLIQRMAPHIYYYLCRDFKTWTDAEYYLEQSLSTRTTEITSALLKHLITSRVIIEFVDVAVWILTVMCLSWIILWRRMMAANYTATADFRFRTKAASCSRNPSPC